MRNLALFLVLLLSVSPLPSCKKADPAPVTGDLSVVITRPSYYPLTSYALYTEPTYGTTFRVNPLRQGPFTSHNIPSGNEQITTTLTKLNAGNYVFVFSGTTLSVQVTLGQLNTYYYSI